MSYRIEVVENEALAIHHRIVPVRFARATEGVPDRFCPDLDDAGFRQVPNCSARGPAVGMRRGTEIRILIVRDRLSTAAPLYVSVNKPKLLKISHPLSEAPLNPHETPGDCIALFASKKARDGSEAIVQIRFGKPEGPVMAELSIRIHKTIPIPIQVHRPSIGGTAAKVNAKRVRALLKTLNAVFASAGLFFTRATKRIPCRPARGRFSYPGAVVEGNYSELARTLGTHPHPTALNVFMIPIFVDTAGQSTQMIGQGWSQDLLRRIRPQLTPADPPPAIGMMMASSVSDRGTQDLLAAHEIGHVLGLSHYGLAELGSGLLEDLWANRNRMNPSVQLHSSGNNPFVARGHKNCDLSSARQAVGYGQDPGGIKWTGSALTCKPVSGVDLREDQVKTVRSIAKNNGYRYNA